jgi:hypothetical protein
MWHVIKRLFRDGMYQEQQWYIIYFCGPMCKFYGLATVQYGNNCMNQRQVYESMEDWKEGCGVLSMITVLSMFIHKGEDAPLTIWRYTAETRPNRQISK